MLRFGPRDRAVRQAAALFTIAGIIGLINDALPGAVGYSKATSALFDAANLAAGIVAVLLPWRRWSPRASLVLVAVALGNIVASSVAGVMPQSTIAISLVLVFVWIGSWHPPRTSLAVGPFVGLAYLLAIAVGPPQPSGAMSSVIVSVSVAVLVGETIARNQSATRTAQLAQADAMRALGRATVTDDLTGLGNRRHGNTMLESLAVGDTLAVLDLDQFKRINDSYGHPVGDEVLQQFSSYLLGAVRRWDSVARFGGEEFIVVLRGTDSVGLDAVERLLVGWRALSPLTTFSAGVAVHQPDQAPSSTFSNADAALYRAKELGRDQVAVHAENPTRDEATAAEGVPAPRVLR